MSPGTELERELRAAAAVPLWRSVLEHAPEVDLCHGYQGGRDGLSDDDFRCMPWHWARDLRDAWVITPETGPDPQIVFGEAEAWATVHAYSGAVSMGRVGHHLALEWAAEELRCFYMTQDDRGEAHLWGATADQHRAFREEFLPAQRED